VKRTGANSRSIPTQNENTMKASQNKNDFNIHDVGVFAVWQLTNEVIREKADELVSSLDEVTSWYAPAETEGTGSFVEVLRRSFRGATSSSEVDKKIADLKRCIHLQSEQEKNRLFTKFNEKCNDLASQSDFEMAFARVDSSEQQFLEAVEKDKAGDKNISKASRTALLTWSNELKKYLSLKEEILVPFLEALADTMLERGAVVQSVITFNRKEFIDFQLGYVLSALENTKDYAYIKYFMSSLRLASNPDEYLEYKAVVSQAIRPATWQQLARDGFDSDGEQPQESEPAGAKFEDSEEACACCILL